MLKEMNEMQWIWKGNECQVLLTNTPILMYNFTTIWHFGFTPTYTKLSKKIKYTQNDKKNKVSVSEIQAKDT